MTLKKPIALAGLALLSVAFTPAQYEVAPPHDMQRLEYDVKRMEDLFRGKDEAYALWPPELVIGAQVSLLSWSASGRYVVGTQLTRNANDSLVRSFLLDLPVEPLPRSELGVFLWSVRDRKVVTVWKSSEPVDLSTITWIGQGDFALFTVSANRISLDGKVAGIQVVLLLDAKNGRVRQVNQAVSNESTTALLNVECSRNAPFAVVIGTENRDSSLATTRATATIVTADGKAGKPIDLPPGQYYSGVLFSSRERRCFLKALKDRTPGVPREYCYYELDPSRNTAKACAKPENASPIFVLDSMPQPEIKGIVVRTDRQSVGRGAAARVVGSAWLSVESVPDAPGRPTAAMVASDCDTAILSPTLEGVLYLNRGALFFRKIQRLTLEEFEQIAESEARKAAMLKAKYVGIGILMYAADWDDMLPTPDGLADKIAPYIKDVGLLDGFVYTFQGGLATDIESPTETQLGYVDGVGGRAVVFADGHVKWVKK
jgi:prepilin-type processing-associated H-X9-DG protein